MSGSATGGDDYAALSGTVVLAADATSAVIDINPMDDALSDGDETVVLTLVSDPAYFVGAGGSAMIADNDFVVSIAATDADAAETGLNPGRFTVSRIRSARSV